MVTYEQSVSHISVNVCSLQTPKLNWLSNPRHREAAALTLRAFPARAVQTTKVTCILPDKCHTLNNVDLNKIYLCTWYNNFCFDYLSVIDIIWSHLKHLSGFINALCHFIWHNESTKNIFSQKKSFPMNSLWPKLQNEMKTWISLDKSIRTLFQNIPSYWGKLHLSWEKINPQKMYSFMNRYFNVDYDKIDDVT